MTIITSLRAALLCLLLSVGAAPAWAQEPSPSHLAAARELIDLTGVLASVDAFLTSFNGEIRQRNVTRPDLTKDLDEVLNGLQPELQLQRAQVQNLVVRSYAKFFTEDELKGIIAFYRSPLGTKFLKTQPDLIDEVSDEITLWSQQASEYVMTRTRAEMAKRGHQMQ